MKWSIAQMSVFESCQPRWGVRVLALSGLMLLPALAGAQVYGGPSPITGSGGRTPQQDEIPSTPVPPKPDKAAAKAYAAGMKSLSKARDLEAQYHQLTDADKKAKTLEKLGDTYGAALDQFTEVLRNRSDMFDAWNQVGYVHLKLGAYREAIDDYNHALALKSDLEEAVAHRAYAYMATDRLEDAKAAYMELFNHERSQADQLMLVMQDWLTRHRASANGVRPGDIDSFDKWLTERSGIAKTAANP
jgi:tetratricopeptide (TPR) repeat protein